MNLPVPEHVRRLSDRLLALVTERLWPIEAPIVSCGLRREPPGPGAGYAPATGDCVASESDHGAGWRA